MYKNIQMYGTEFKNTMMERFIKCSKDRTNCFDYHFRSESQIVTGSISGTG
jgi:hypothetical protein